MTSYFKISLLSITQPLQPHLSCNVTWLQPWATISFRCPFKTTVTICLSSSRVCRLILDRDSAGTFILIVPNRGVQHRGVLRKTWELGGGGDPLTAAQQTLDLTVQATRRSHSETQYLDHTLAAFHCVCHPQQHPVSQKGSIDGHQPQVCVGVSLEDKHQAQG